MKNLICNFTQVKLYLSTNHFTGGFLGVRSLLSKIVISTVLILSLHQYAQANIRPNSASKNFITTQEVYLTVSQYELALIQVLSEICPPMLDSYQKTRFNRAYEAQLQIFMPYASNPSETLRQLTAQRDYRIILQKVRAWTKSYPVSENRALCREFAQMNH